MTEIHRGTCFCGAVEVEVRGEPLEMGYCHCNSCRTYSGAPLVSYILYKAEDVTVTRGRELICSFMKTPMSDRQHCTRCGGHLITGHPSFGVTDVRPPALPGVVFKPSVHLHYGERVLPVQDGLPKLKDFSAEIGGSGEHMPE
jgi:hypothetical protein